MSIVAHDLADLGVDKSLHFEPYWGGGFFSEELDGITYITPELKVEHPETLPRKPDAECDAPSGKFRVVNHYNPKSIYVDNEDEPYLLFDTKGFFLLEGESFTGFLSPKDVLLWHTNYNFIATFDGFGLRRRMVNGRPNCIIDGVEYGEMGRYIRESAFHSFFIPTHFYARFDGSICDYPLSGHDWHQVNRNMCLTAEGKILVFAK
jgi:hypothetical protein